ncbi:MAG: hypothetical protein ACI35V_04980 [Sphingobacterium composti]|uniref:hypothetical protein n=1 Tax=Sphingobacterium composti TaxID=363260 RepID=UPI001356B6FA|nr:hypothetical protein [Sphingobacterium composti Ten et al. 2007 non Yoo et al. 2007]
MRLHIKKARIVFELYIYYDNIEITIGYKHEEGPQQNLLLMKSNKWNLAHAFSSFY